jgi:hypothetical protein
MQVELNYGRGKLPVQLPNDFQVTVLRKQPMPVLADPSAAVYKAFRETVGTAPLEWCPSADRNPETKPCSPQTDILLVAGDLEGSGPSLPLSVVSLHRSTVPTERTPSSGSASNGLICSGPLGDRTLPPPHHPDCRRPFLPPFLKKNSKTHRFCTLSLEKVLKLARKR